MSHVSPSHYARLEPQPIVVIEMVGADFNVGSVIKYTARAGFKDEIRDELVKIRYYLERYQARVESTPTCSFEAADKALEAVIGWDLNGQLAGLTIALIQSLVAGHRDAWVRTALRYLEQARRSTAAKGG